MNNLTPNAKGRLAYEEMRLDELRQEIERQRIGDALNASHVCRLRVAVGHTFAIVMQKLAGLVDRLSKRLADQIEDLSSEVFAEVINISED